jgi:hypothetical protein
MGKSHVIIQTCSFVFSVAAGVHLTTPQYICFELLSKYTKSLPSIDFSEFETEEAQTSCVEVNERIVLSQNYNIRKNRMF